jgi:hypothetical protein
LTDIPSSAIEIPLPGMSTVVYTDELFLESIGNVYCGSKIDVLNRLETVEKEINDKQCKQRLSVASLAPNVYKSR